MNLQSPRVWLAFFSGMVVFLLALRDAGKVSPGDLATAHALVPELADRDSCAMCHGGGAVSMGASCLECHEVIETQLDDEEGLHGGLGRAIADGCALCHSEHHGSDFSLINSRSFVLAGSAAGEDFDHDVVDFSMTGKHLELACSKCHDNAEVDVLEEGMRRFIGLDQSCATCHEDPHQGQMSRSCADCHGQETFQEFEDFSHDDRFALEDSHADVSCLACHEAGLPHSVEALDSAEHESPVRACGDCHESPHEKKFLRRAAVLSGQMKEGDCTTCHLVEHVAFRDIGLEITPEYHAGSGFSLAPPHADVGCSECHAADAGTFAGRFPGRSQDACSACHEDPHAGQFDEGPFANGCLDCHDRLAFEPHQFTKERHAETRLDLSGGHSELECSACHEDPVQDEVRLFEGTERACEACHEDGHDGFFASFAIGLEANDNGECARCHTSGSFSQGAFSGFDHATWTGFEVQGAHAQNACETCHERSPEADASGRTFGHATEIFGPVDGCASCHMDPHEGQFEGPGTPEQIDDRVGCARCHVESSFRSLDLGFDHELWTGFGLEGIHAQISCSECHTPLAEDRSSGRSFGRAKGTSCSDCHGYPHAGQFSVDGSTSCVRCHEAEAMTFSELVFDHDKDSRFPLEDAHRLLSCSDCHRGWQLGDGLEVVRYRPLGLECADCHGSSEGGNARRKRRVR